MRSILAVVLMLGLAAAHAADDKKTEKKSSKPKSTKSEPNPAQKAEASIGKWARENHIWGKPRPGDNPR